MQTIQIKEVQEFTDEMEAFRRSAFHDPTMTISSADEFDSYSTHIIALVDGVLAGMVRLTSEPPSVLQKWSSGKALAPAGQGVAFASRAVVAGNYRGLGIYKVLMFECMAWCRRHQIKYVLGTIALDFPLRPFLNGIGFYDSGEPCVISNYPVPPSLCRCICCDVPSAWPLVTKAYHGLLSKLESLQILLNSRGDFRATPSHDSQQANTV